MRCSSGGRLAQWLERSPHTREVEGSSPSSPTTLSACSILILPSNVALPEHLISPSVPNQWPDQGRDLERAVLSRAVRWPPRSELRLEAGVLLKALELGAFLILASCD